MLYKNTVIKLWILYTADTSVTIMHDICIRDSLICKLFASSYMIMLSDHDVSVQYCYIII